MAINDKNIKRKLHNCITVLPYSYPKKIYTYQIVGTISQSTKENDFFQKSIGVHLDLSIFSLINKM